MHEHAGRQARPQDLIDLDALTRAYYETHPDPTNVAHRVAFGTSGHRGSSLDAAFNVWRRLPALDPLFCLGEDDAP